MTISVIVEVYKVLQSCQVSLYCEPYALFTKFKLSVTCNTITIMNSVDKCLCEIAFSEIKLKPTSISGLMIDENIITFRVQIESQVNLTQLENKAIKYVPDVCKGTEVSIVCLCCNYNICSGVYCNRVLPLPSSDWNIDDFFCHKHDHNEGDNKQSINNRLRIVAKGDLLYDDNYSFRINTNYVTSKENGVFHCEKCFSWIGKKTENFVKLWHSTVLISDNIQKHYTINPLCDFNNVIFSMLDCIRPTFKIVVTCSVTNKSEQFILLNILNKSLTVLTNCQPNSVVEKNSEVVKLCERNVVKVSYNFVEGKNETVETWLNDPYIETVEVSKQMLFAGCNALLKSTLLIAKPYRFIENMKIGFVGLV